VGAFTAIDLFCGAGGLSAGFVQEGYEIALGIDFDAAAIDTYAANFGAGKARQEDLLDFTASDVRRLVGRDVDVILGGPSCQPFSTHGRQNRWVVGDPRSDLWSRMHSYVDELRPRAFLMENVPGMLYFGQGTFVGALTDAFRELGYTLTHQIVLAADYNVPQLRRRLIVVGVLGNDPFVFPEPPRLGGWRRDSLAKWEAKRIASNKLPHVTLRQALDALPVAVSPGQAARYRLALPPNSYDAYMRTPWRSVPAQGAGTVAAMETVTDHERVPIIEEVRDLAKHVPPGGTWRDIPPHLLPDRFRAMRRTDGTNLYGRMTWNRPAYTMTTQFQNITTGCFIHPDEDRPLTVREGARVQSFSDDFVFVGTTGAKVRLIGNAVPPLLARAFARQLATHLDMTEPVDPLVVGSTSFRGVAVPGGLAAAEELRSSGKHDDAARRVLADYLGKLDESAVSGYRVEGTDIDADIALPERKIVVFVNGCFIYGCAQHSRGTKSQDVWWKDDIDRRVTARAAEVEELHRAGWVVHVVWEHEDPAAACERVLSREVAA
jgi:DNA (cytosine-5)-methyltransferase 1